MSNYREGEQEDGEYINILNSRKSKYFHDIIVDKSRATIYNGLKWA